MPKIDLSTNINSGNGFEIPKAQLAKTHKQLQAEKRIEEEKSLIPFSLDTQYDLETYMGRFKSNLERQNPLHFFTSDKTILEAKELIYKHKLREEAARNMG